jgi:uncharacterized protein
LAALTAWPSGRPPINEDVTHRNSLGDGTAGDGTAGDKINDAEIIAATRRWLERSVIGLGLCPFAENPYKAGRVRFRVSAAREAADLLDELREELQRLQAEDAAVCETSLLIHPLVFEDFLEYNEFLSICDALLVELGLEGELQIASFHPHYQFADTQSTDIENFTNRSPYPMLHLLREASIERVLENVADPHEIYRRNIRTMRELGHAGWRALFTAG